VERSPDGRKRYSLENPICLPKLLRLLYKRLTETSSPAVNTKDDVSTVLFVTELTRSCSNYYTRTQNRSFDRNCTHFMLSSFSSDTPSEKNSHRTRNKGY